MRRRLAAYAAVALLTLVGAAVAFLGGLTWWVDSSDAPAPADRIVVLSGAYARSLYAARLYSEKYAPEVWLSRPKRAAADLAVADAGVALPSEPEIHRALLIKGGVPPERIHLYGQDVNSTAEEAAALRGALGDTRDKVLIVTSRYHVRRTRIVFRRYLPHADVRVVATPSEARGSSWWARKDLSEHALLEPLKMAHYLAQRLAGTLPPVR